MAVARKFGWRAQNTVNTTQRGRRSGQTAAALVIVAADAIKSKKKKEKIERESERV